MSDVNERVETAVRNIMSGSNACGTLANAARGGDADYFRQAVLPVAEVYDQETAELRGQRDAALRDAEIKRYALESVVSNLDLPEGPLLDAIRRALPGHPLLNKGK